LGPAPWSACVLAASRLAGTPLGGLNCHEFETRRVGARALPGAGGGRRVMGSGKEWRKVEAVTDRAHSNRSRLPIERSGGEVQSRVPIERTGGEVGSRLPIERTGGRV
jgi:hypothetical protein